MKHLRLLSVLLLLMAHQVLWAGPRTYRQAQAIAEKLAQQMGVSITPQAKARSFGDANATAASQAYYVFPYGEGRGYAIVSGDDQMPEIVAYSDKGTFDEEKMSDGCREFLNAYKQMADAVAQGDANALKQVAQKRSLMNAANYQQPTVAPLLGDIQWNQAAPYNNLCPLNKDYQKRCVTGCVATAMAQVMRYWKYPASLQADIPAYTSQSSGETYEMPQIDKGVEYDWDNMLPNYSTTTYTQQQANAVATLMQHCGAAVNMQYSIDGSGAKPDPQVFVKYFGYDPDMVSLVYRNAYGFKQWCQLIDQELINKRPVLYAGLTATLSGHQFVCDGADGKGFYHINWGWSGNSDGYYDIAILSPDERGIGAGAGSNGYNRDVNMMIGLQPDNGKKDEPLVTRAELVSAQEDRDLTIIQADRKDVDGKFKLIYHAVYANQESKPFRGYVSVAVKDEQGNLHLIAEPQLIEELKVPSESTLDAIDIYYEFSYAFPVGTTELYDVYSLDEGKTWTQCFPLYDLRHLAVVATDTHLDLHDEMSKLKTTLQPVGDVIERKEAAFTYTISNANPYDYLSTLYVFAAHSNKIPDSPFHADYVDVAAGGSTTHSFELMPSKAGKLYVWIYDVENDKMLLNGEEIDVKKNENIKFKLLSKSINLKEGVLECEHAYLEGFRVKMPVVDGDEAVVKYELQNNGPTLTNASIPLYLMSYNADDYDTNKIDKTFTLEGNGAVNELEYRFKASDLGGNSSFTCRMGGTVVGLIDYSSIATFHIDLVDYDNDYTIYDDALCGYFASSPTSITAPAVIGGLQVRAGKGYLSLTADTSQQVDVYNLAGQKVRTLSLQAAHTTTVNLPSGIYVIGKQKIMIR